MARTEKMLNSIYTNKCVLIYRTITVHLSAYNDNPNLNKTPRICLKAHNHNKKRGKNSPQSYCVGKHQTRDGSRGGGTVAVSPPPGIFSSIYERNSLPISCIWYPPPGKILYPIQHSTQNLSSKSKSLL